MRHTIVVLVALAVALLGWRIAAVVASGREQHAREVAARAIAERILRAQKERATGRSRAPGDDPIGPFAFLSTLVDEKRVDGLVRVATSAERDLWRNDHYVFHIRLLNKLGRPLARRPERPEEEPGLGSEFELWAWPLDRKATSLALFFASDSGMLLQGDNGAFAGWRARPEDVSPLPPVTLERDPELDGAGDQWIVVADVDAPAAAPPAPPPGERR